MPGDSLDQNHGAGASGRGAVLSREARVCLTGATGSLGSALAARLASRGQAGVLVQGRARSGRSLAERVRGFLFEQGLDCPRSWGFVEADLGADSGDALGRSLRAFRPDIVVHAAADTSLVNAWGCDRVNRLGTRTLLGAVADLPVPALFVYISTAYVRGFRAGRLVREEEGRAGPDEPHLGLYTRSKADGERLVEESGLASLILRPSILVGEDGSGAWVRALSRAAARLGEAPVDPDGAVDVIPRSFCVEAVLALLGRGVSGGACNISAGERALRCRDLVRLGSGVRGRPDALRLTPPGEWDREAFARRATREERYALAKISPLLPYLNLDATFCNRRLSDATGLTPPAPRALEAAILPLIGSPDR